jgi:hypothetical protein
MPREDDPSLTDDLVVYRRIPPYGGRVEWSESGEPSFTSQNFSDPRDEWSAHLANESTPEVVLESHDGFGLVQLTLGDIRAAFANRPLVICRDDEDPANGHILVCGKASPAVRTKLKAVATWVPGKLPNRSP